MKTRRQMVVVVELGLVLIALGISYWWVRNTALAADSPFSVWIEQIQPPTPTLDWRKAEDIWALTPPPEWTPPPTPQSNYTPQPSASNDIPTSDRPTPTLLPERGIRLNEPVELNALSALRNVSQTQVKFLHPDFDGNVLVIVADYADYQSVLAVDVETQHAYSLVEEPPIDDERATIDNLHISGKYVAWTTSRHNSSMQNTLHIYNLETNVLTATTLTAHNMDFSGNVIVFQRPGQLGWGWDIWGYDLEQDQTFPIIQGPEFQGGAQVSQDWIVYEDGTRQDALGEVDLYALNLKTEQKILLGKVYEASDSVVPPLYAIDAPWVVWSTPSTLNLYRLDTGEQFTTNVTACASDGRPGYLKIEDNIVIFSCGQWMGYDLSQQIFFSLPIRSVPNGLNMNWREWAFSNQHVAWVMTGSGSSQGTNNRIFVASIEYIQ